MVDRIRVKRTITIEYIIIPTITMSPETIRKQERELDLESIASMLKFVGPQGATSSVEFEEVYDVPE